MGRVALIPRGRGRETAVHRLRVPRLELTEGQRQPRRPASHWGAVGLACASPCSAHGDFGTPHVPNDEPTNEHGRREPSSELSFARWNAPRSKRRTNADFLSLHERRRAFVRRLERPVFQRCLVGLETLLQVLTATRHSGISREWNPSIDPVEAPEVPITGVDKPYPVLPHQRRAAATPRDARRERRSQRVWMPACLRSSEA
jgi:hypothetical protein